MVLAETITSAVTPVNDAGAENDALVSLMAEFSESGDTTKVSYLKHRYAGFTRKEAATLAGVKITTTNKWLKEDSRVAHFDNLVSTGKRRELRKDVLQEEWFRNFYLVLERDKYILNSFLKNWIGSH